MAQRFWPDGNQCAAVVTVNFDGESVERRTMPDQPLWGRTSYGRYGAQIGVRRILDLLDRYGVRATFFIPAWDADRYPEVMERIVAAGHEVAGHGYLHEDFTALSIEEQRDVLQQGEDVFQRVFGGKPAGWRAPDGLMTSATRPLLLERGYRYDSSFCDDDLPYVVGDDTGGRLVELPVFATAGDRLYYALRRSPELVADAWAQELDAVYQVGGLFNLTLHPRGDYGSGRGVRIRAAEAIFQRLREYPGIWTATCREVADWTLEHPADGKIWPA